MSPPHGDASAGGFLERLLAAMVPRWRGRADSEHEQAVIRILVGGVASAYLLQFAASPTSANPGQVFATRVGVIAFFALASLILLWLFLDPAVNVTRRVCGCILDNAGATVSLLVNGDLAAPVFIAYLWVTFGNGFRYGRRYLLFSGALSALGFASVLLTASEWRVGLTVNAGLLTGLVALPLYVSSLLRRLETALRKAEVANVAKTNFLATMSHEIRTPLNGLIGMLDLLGMSELQARQQHYVDLMKSSSGWLLQVISDGLDYTKIEAGELVIESEVVSIEETVRDISGLFHEVSRSKNLSFRVDLSEEVPGHVLSDRTRLNQILNNLLGNACKFTEEGEVGLSVTSKNRISDRVTLVFQVEDSGVGIPADHLEAVFEPFKQVESTGSAANGGTGLGLAIVSRLVGLMGGDISVVSEPGAGATFTVSLDVPIAPEPAAEEPDAPRRGIRWRRSPRVLLVEDNTINQEVAGTYLGLLGCEVTTADNGQDALDRIGETSFDLVLMDCQMPRMDGYEATRMIRQREERENTIIALTAHVTQQDRLDCLAAGMNDYMGKPFRVDTLEHMLRKWLPSLADGQGEPLAPRTPRVESVPPDTASERGRGFHDLRNALGAVMGGLELALLFADDPVRRGEKLAMALEAARRAVSILSELEKD